MHKKALYTIIIWLVIISGYACGYYNCNEAPGLRISTIAMSASEIDTIVLRKFAKGSNFTMLLDTLQLDSTNTMFQFPFSGTDTSFMGLLKDETLLKSKYDYQVFIPAVNKLVKITEINEPQQKVRSNFLVNDKLACANIIQSYKMDGQLLTGTDFEYNYVYIKK